MRTGLERFVRSAIAALAVFTAGGASAEEAAEVADPRTRTLVAPTRVVWQTGEVAESARLLDRGWLQVPRNGLGRPEVACRLVNRGSAPGVLLDFGRELHGGVRLGFGEGPRGMRLRVRFGESVAEAMSEPGERGACNDHAIHDDVVDVPMLGVRELGNTGFRFVRLDLVGEGSVNLEFVRAVSLMRPMRRLGAFRCSDERLDRIWETAVRTVHLCCQDYLWDGVKRDRLVWMGDTHPETMTILSVFGDGDDILPRSLDYMAGATPPDAWMNTMPTYTLWWLRNVAEWYRFTGDRAWVKARADYIRATFAHVETGMSPGGEWLAGTFLDWPTHADSAGERAGTQGLALMTARDVAVLAEALGDADLAARARAMETKLAALRPEPGKAKSAAALLALSGLRDPKEMFATVLGRGGHAGVSTFYGYYMLEAMSAAGEDARALETVRDYWGAMLDVGATSFWEDFDLAWTNGCFRIDELPVAGRKDIHGDYGDYCYKGFRHSLCHGWSAGPADWLVRHVLGIRPLDVGCRTVEVKPFLGDLEWAEGAMALPGGGRVSVRVEKGPDGGLRTTVDAPEGVEIRR